VRALIDELFEIDVPLRPLAPNALEIMTDLARAYGAVSPSLESQVLVARAVVSMRVDLLRFTSSADRAWSPVEWWRRQLWNEHPSFAPAHRRHLDRSKQATTHFDQIFEAMQSYYDLLTKTQRAESVVGAEIGLGPDELWEEMHYVLEPASTRPRQFRAREGFRERFLAHLDTVFPDLATSLRTDVITLRRPPLERAHLQSTTRQTGLTEFGRLVGAELPRLASESKPAASVPRPSLESIEDALESVRRPLALLTHRPNCALDLEPRPTPELVSNPSLAGDAAPLVHRESPPLLDSGSNEIEDVTRDWLERLDVLRSGIEDPQI
jgi:hypothetical protein